MRIVTLEEGMTIVEKGITKAKMIMDGYPSYELFTSEEYMMVYQYPFLVLSFFVVKILY